MTNERKEEIKTIATAVKAIQAESDRQQEKSEFCGREGHCSCMTDKDPCCYCGAYDNEE